MTPPRAAPPVDKVIELLTHSTCSWSEGRPPRRRPAPAPSACPAPTPEGAGCAGRRHPTGRAAAGQSRPAPAPPPTHPWFGSGSVAVITSPFTNFPANPAGPTLHEQRSAGATPASACSMCRPQPAHVGFPHAPQSTRRHIARPAPPRPPPAPPPPPPPPPGPRPLRRPPPGGATGGEEAQDCVPSLPGGGAPWEAACRSSESATFFMSHSRTLT